MTKRFTSNNGVFYTDNLTGWEFESYGEVVDLMNNLHEKNQKIFDKIDKSINWHMIQARKCRNEGNVKKAEKFEICIMTLQILRRELKE